MEVTRLIKVLERNEDEITAATFSLSKYILNAVAFNLTNSDLMPLGDQWQ